MKFEGILSMKNQWALIYRKIHNFFPSETSHPTNSDIRPVSWSFSNSLKTSRSEGSRRHGRRMVGSWTTKTAEMWSSSFAENRKNPPIFTIFHVLIFFRKFMKSTFLLIKYILFQWHNIWSTHLIIGIGHGNLRGPTPQNTTRPRNMA